LEGADRGAVLVPRGYRSRPAGSGLVDLFVDRVEDYRATVVRCGEAEVESAIAAVLPTAARVVLPAGLRWQVPGTVDDRFSADDLDRFDSVVTAASVGIAETGTIVLTHGDGEGRRAISLVPDLHVCVVRADQVVAGVPDAVARLDPLRPQTWISGPSATSDIELDRVEGVHGPRTLHVSVVEGPRG
jgi:L-lactate dehydrogenase complex protein LldG